ncbi:hypothetical protein TNCT_177651 [Trichonephila clavata]|uniref:Uncharacterized protein n=1 Tax=Trichonephila clavata TaxID=2740835 RepID=A0A8X6FEI9_TRICU|nr:hypothetical protein TNCT_177651 [Trichonephila clavata]
MAIDLLADRMETDMTRLYWLMTWKKAFGNKPYLQIMMNTGLSCHGRQCCSLVMKNMYDVCSTEDDLQKFEVLNDLSDLVLSALSPRDGHLPSKRFASETETIWGNDNTPALTHRIPGLNFPTTFPDNGLEDRKRGKTRDKCANWDP